MKNHSPLIGFTLVDLLLAAAIIAILSAIAVPNLCEARMRAKVSRVKNDFRTLDVALNAYRLENRKYPYPRGGSGVTKSFINSAIEFTTPIAYLSGLDYRDPFQPKRWDSAMYGMSYSPYRYTCYEGFWADVCFAYRTPHISGFMLQSYGPGGFPTFPEWYISSDSPGQPIRIVVPFRGYNLVYDPTNGTVSNGEIIRIGGIIEGAPQ